MAQITASIRLEFAGKVTQKSITIDIPKGEPFPDADRLAFTLIQKLYEAPYSKPEEKETDEKA